MSDLLKLMQQRRSIRRYTGEPVTEEELQYILDAGLLAPSGRNIQPVSFVVVQDRDMLKKLSEAKTGGSAFLEEAAAAVIVLGDHERSDTWIEDASLAMAHMQLAATECGLGCCWVQCRGRMSQHDMPTDEYVSQLMGAPDQYSVEAILSLGRPAQILPPRTAEEAAPERIYRETMNL